MKKILFALCLLLFASCTRDVVLVLPPVSPRLVLNASVSPDTDVTAFLSKSWFVLDTVTDDGVEDGSIQVFINDRLQGRMQPVSDSRFTGRYVLPGCRVRAGDRLRLEAEAGGFDPVGGETVIPDPVEVLIRSVLPALVMEDMNILPYGCMSGSVTSWINETIIA